MQNPFFSIEETIEGLLSHPHDVTSTCLDLIRGLLKKDTKKRFRLEQVREHEWTTMEVDPAQYKFVDVIDCCKCLNVRFNGPVVMKSGGKSETSLATLRQGC